MEKPERGYEGNPIKIHNEWKQRERAESERAAGKKEEEEDSNNISI
jgi:hypothetical protein